MTLSFDDGAKIGLSPVFPDLSGMRGTIFEPARSGCRGQNEAPATVNEPPSRVRHCIPRYPRAKSGSEAPMGNYLLSQRPPLHFRLGYIHPIERTVATSEVEWRQILAPMPPALRHATSAS